MRRSAEIIIYSKIVRIGSGVQTFERNLIKLLKRQIDNILYVYEAGDKEAIEEFAEIVDMQKNKGKVFSCKTCIYSSIKHDNFLVEAEKKIQVCHAELSKFQLVPDKKMDIYVAVGAVVQKDLSKIGIDSTVISNPVLDTLGDVTEGLQFMTASRLEQKKGIERIGKVAKVFHDKLNKPFSWDIYGKGSRMMTKVYKEELEPIQEISFKGVRNNTDILGLMKRADYVVQLSDTEGFCYSIHEAIGVGTPVIVTDWDGVRDVVSPNGVVEDRRGYILDMDLGNIDNVIAELNDYPIREVRCYDTSVEVQKKWFEVIKL